MTLFGDFIFFANGTVFFSRTRGSEGSWAYSGKAHCAGDAACQVGPNEIQKIWGTPKVVQYGGVYLPYIMRELSHCLGYSPDRGPPFPSPLIVTYPTTHGGDSASRCHAPHDQVVVCLFRFFLIVFFWIAQSKKMEKLEGFAIRENSEYKKKCWWAQQQNWNSAPLQELSEIHKFYRYHLQLLMTRAPLCLRRTHRSET